MLVLSHSPVPSVAGEIFSGCGRPAWPATLVNGTTGRLNTTVMGASTATSSLPSPGCVLVTWRKPTVLK